MLSIDGTFLVIFLSFFVFMFVMKGLFFEPIMTLKREREGTVEAGQQAAEDAVQKRTHMLREYEQQLTEAKRKAQAVIQEKREWAKSSAASHLGKSREQALSDYEKQAALLKEARERVYQELQSERDAMAKTIVEKLNERQASSVAR